MQKLIGIITCSCLCAVIATAGGAKDSPKIEGAWTATGGNSDGKKVPEDILTKINLTVNFKAGKYDVNVMGKEVESGSYKIDAAKKPVQIDMTIAEGKDKGKVQLGIMKLEKDALTIALGKADSKERPKDFDGGENIEVTILKRNK
jgi:uncharacterized protein (TIGR03067 family)